MEIITKEEFNILNGKLDALLKNTLHQDKYSIAILDNEEASKLLKVTKRTLQTYRDTGKISFIQEGSKIWYRQSDIEEFLSARYNKSFHKAHKTI